MLTVRGTGSFTTSLLLLALKGLQRTGISPLTRPGARRHGRVGSRCASKAGHRHTIPPPSDGRLQQATATTTSAGRLLLVSLSPLTQSVF